MTTKVNPIVKNRITHHEREKFLEHVRDGHSRAAAARRVNPDYSGTMFSRLMSQNSISYDHDFALAYLEAQAVAKDAGKRKCVRKRIVHSRPRTINGAIRAMHISEDAQEEFIRLVTDGTPVKAAADQIGTSLYQLDVLCRYDPDFARLYAEAKRHGYPAMQENLRAETMRQAFAGDYRALRDLNIIHLPEYAILNRAAKGEHDVDLRTLLLERMGNLPPEVLDEMIKLIEGQADAESDGEEDDGEEPPQIVAA